MDLTELLRRGTAAISQAARNLVSDVTVPPRVTSLRDEVGALELKLSSVAQTSGSFLTRTGQRVESHEVRALRRELTEKRTELAFYEAQLEDRAAYEQTQRLDVVREPR